MYKTPTKPIDKAAFKANISKNCFFSVKAVGVVNNHVLDSPKTLNPSSKPVILTESLFGSKEKLLLEHMSAVVGGHEFKLNSKNIISKIINKKLMPTIINLLISKYLRDKKKDTSKNDKDPLLEPINDIQYKEKKKNTLIYL